MTVHSLKRHIAAFGALLGLGTVMPLALAATPAYAAPALAISKTHEGTLVRGELGFYRITVVNTGDSPTSVGTEVTDPFPQGVTLSSFQVLSSTPGVTLGCLNSPSRLDCVSSPLQPGDSYTLRIGVAVADDVPCTVTNTATVTTQGSGVTISASDTTSIPGPNCIGGGGGSLLPVTLNGVIPMFNNITTNSNISSPGAANVSNQGFAVNAPSTDQ